MNKPRILVKYIHPNVIYNNNIIELYYYTLILLLFNISNIFLLLSILNLNINHPTLIV